MPYVPSVSIKEGNTEKFYDIFSMLLKDRIIMVGEEIAAPMAQIIVAELLYLDAQDSTKPIYMYINSPGGSIIDGLSIIDTMNIIKAPVYTYVTGMAASMGSVIFANGEKGHRCMLPNAQVMLHQASTQTGGNIQDIKISLKHTEKLNDLLLNMLADLCGKTYDEIQLATIRDNWMDAKQSVDFGIADMIQSK